LRRRLLKPFAARGVVPGPIFPVRIDFSVETSMPSRKKKDALATVEDIRDDLQALREDIAHLADQVGDSVAETSDTALNEAKAQLRRIKDNVDAMISGAGEKGREASEAVRDVTDNFAEAVEESLRSRPLTTLAMAVGIGFVFGAVWRR